MSGITTRIRRAPMVTIAMLAIVAPLVTYAGFRANTSRNQPPTPVQNTPASASQRSETLEVELITVESYGFEPSTITRPKGPFILLVDDRTGKDSSSLQLQRVNGERVRDVRTNKTKSEWNSLLDLPPGDYVLTIAGSPDSQCQIKIQP